MRLAVTGSHGLIGSALVRALEGDGHHVVRLVRGQPAGPGEATWDPRGGHIDRAALAGLDGVVHLAGEPIGTGRWSDAKKRRIRASREEGTLLLSRALAGLDEPPPVLVSGSAIGIYGDRGADILTEDSPPGEGFLAEVCAAWEDATAPAAEAGIRVVCVRTGLVLSARGGALGRMLPLFKLGLGGKLASGRQWWSWITLDDELGLIRHAVASGDVRGPLNATAPNPVTNAEFSRVLARVLRRPAVLPAPAPALKLVMGPERTEEMLLASQRVLPTRAQASGYAFAHAELESGLRAILGR